MCEPYFTFTPDMLSLAPEGFSLRWYRDILENGMAQPDQAKWTAAYSHDAWTNGQLAAGGPQQLLSSASRATALATVARDACRPGALAAELSLPETDHRGDPVADDRSDRHHLGRLLLLLLAVGLRTPISESSSPTRCSACLSWSSP